MRKHAGIVIALVLSGCQLAQEHPFQGPSSTKVTVSPRLRDQPEASADSHQADSHQVVTARAVPVSYSEVDELADATAEPRLAVAMSVTLDEAIQLALERNPDLIALRQNEPVSLATFHAAQTYLYNPQFQTQILPYSRDRDGNTGSVSQQHVIVQTFELAHQQQFREDSARAALNQVRWTLQQAYLLNIAQTERFFFAALSQRQLTEQAKSIADLNEELLNVVQRRFKAGLAKKTDVILARQTSLTSRRQAELAEATYQTRLLDLRRYLNIQDGVPFDIEGDLARWKWRSVAQALQGWSASSYENRTQPSANQNTPPLPELKNDALSLDLNAQTIDDMTLASLVSERPDVMSARAAVGVAASNHALARAARTPNLQMGPMYQRDQSATEFWGIQAQINLPVVNTGRPLMRQRRMELQRSQVVQNQLEAKARVEARTAIARYARARRLVEQARGDFATTLKKTLAPVDEEFKAGQIDLLRVYAVRASLIQARQTYFSLLTELALSAAEVTAATGLPAQQLFLDPMPASGGSKNVPTP